METSSANEMKVLSSVSILKKAAVELTKDPDQYSEVYVR